MATAADDTGQTGGGTNGDECILTNDHTSQSSSLSGDSTTSEDGDGLASGGDESSVMNKNEGSEVDDDNVTFEDGNSLEGGHDVSHDSTMVAVDLINEAAAPGWPDDPAKAAGGPNDEKDGSEFASSYELENLDGLLTISHGGHCLYQSSPSARHAERLKKCGPETLSPTLKMRPNTIQPLLWKYVVFDINLFEAELSDSRIGECLVYFADMKNVAVNTLSGEECKAHLQTYNPYAVAVPAEAISISFTTTQVTLNVANLQREAVKESDEKFKLRETRDSNLEISNNDRANDKGRYEELTRLISTLTSTEHDTLDIKFLCLKPSVVSGIDAREMIERTFERAMELDQDASSHPLEPWFRKSPFRHDLSVGTVLEAGSTMPEGIVTQAPLTRFRDKSQYMAINVTGAVNQAKAENAAAADLETSSFKALIIPITSAVDNAQFIVAIQPKGRDLYLPTLGETCYMKIPQLKRKSDARVPTVDQVVSFILRKARDLHDDNEDDFFEALNIQVHGLIETTVDRDTVVGLRQRDDSSESRAAHESRIREFCTYHKSHYRTVETTQPEKDEEIWFAAERMDIDLPRLSVDAQVYLVLCPMQAKEDDQGRQQRSPIQVSLPFVDIDPGMTMDRYMAKVLKSESQEGLTATIRRMTSDKTIRAEVRAVSALHNPASAQDVAVSRQSQMAFDYLQKFTRSQDTSIVNLHQSFPVLGALGKVDWSEMNGGAELRCEAVTVLDSPESNLTSRIRQAYEQTLIPDEASKLEDFHSILKSCPKEVIDGYLRLDDAKKEVIRLLCDLPEGLGFIPGVAGSGKTELIKFLVSVAVFGTGTPKGPAALYVSSTNAAVDDMSRSWCDYFEKLGLPGAPTILRLYSFDSTVKSMMSSLVPDPTQHKKYFNGDEAREIINGLNGGTNDEDDNADRTHQWLALYQLASMGLEMEERRAATSKARRPRSLSADTAAVLYYQKNIDRYGDMRDILEAFGRDKSLPNDKFNQLRAWVKCVFHDMFGEFDGIICTTPVVAANATVRRFKAKLVFVDEAARQSELLSLITIANYNPLAWLFFGDTEQLKPYVGFGAVRAYNPFIEQSPVSLQQRAVNAGVELGWLYISHRCKGNLRPFTSFLNYGDQMLGSFTETEKWPKSAIAFSEEMLKLIGNSGSKKRQSRVVVEFPSAIAQEVGTSVKNEVHIKWTTHLLMDLLKNQRLTDVDGKKPARFLIVALYRGQVDAYRRYLADQYMLRRMTKAQFERIEVRTLDSAQGEERDMVVVDYVQTDRAGFCTDASRNCLATTRAKQCELILANTGMVTSAVEQNSKLGIIMSHAKDNGYFVQVLSCSNCSEIDHTDKNCPKLAKHCDWCGGDGHMRATCEYVKCKNCRKLGHIATTCPGPVRCQACGDEEKPHHKTSCKGKNICSICWTSHSGHCRACKHCLKDGHKVNDCNMMPKSKGFKKDLVKRCNCCHEEGHIAKECTNRPPPSRACFSCGETGHLNKDCPTKTCKVCKKPGHTKADCTELICSHCGQQGHNKRQCQNSIVLCTGCWKTGHLAKDCYLSGKAVGTRTRSRPQAMAPGQFEKMKRKRQERNPGPFAALESLDYGIQIPEDEAVEGGDGSGVKTWGVGAGSDVSRGGGGGWGHGADDGGNAGQSTWGDGADYGGNAGQSTWGDRADDGGNAGQSAWGGGSTDGW